MTHDEATEKLEGVHVDTGVVNQFGAGSGTVTQNFHLSAADFAELRLIAPNVPTPPREFVERPELLAELANALQRSGGASLTGRAMASGAGGFGKTLLAYRYAQAHAPQYPGGAYKLACEGIAIVQALNQLLPDHEVIRPLSAEQRATIVRDKLGGGQRTLLILDNIDSAEQWRAFRDSKLLPGSACHVLITTRETEIHDVTAIQVDRLKVNEAIDVLTRYRPSAGLPQNANAIGAILHETECIAAIVAAVGMAMEEDRSDDWGGYAAWLEAAKIEQLPDAQSWLSNYRDYPHKTLAILDDLHHRLSPAAMRAMEYAAILPADTIPKGWLDWLLDRDMRLTESEAGLRAEQDSRGIVRPGSFYVKMMLERGLLRSASHEGMLLSLHRLHAKRVREMLVAEKIQRGVRLEAIVSCVKSRRDILVGVDSSGEARSVNNPACWVDRSLQWELTPLIGVLKMLCEHGLVVQVADSIGWVGGSLRVLGRFADAISLYDASIVRFEQSFVNDQGLLATSYSNIALVLWAKGELPEARKRMERAIEIEERHFPVDSPMLAAGYSNFALILRAQGELVAARKCIERAIEIEEKHLPADNPIFATRYSYLASILRHQGELSEAYKWIERAIEIFKKHFPDTHPSVIVVKANRDTIVNAIRDKDRQHASHR